MVLNESKLPGRWLKAQVAMKGAKLCPRPWEKESHSIHPSHLAGCRGQICHEDGHAVSEIPGWDSLEMVTISGGNPGLLGGVAINPTV